MDLSKTPKLLGRRARKTVKDLVLSSSIAVLIIWFLPSSSLRCVLLYAVTIIFLTNVVLEFVIDWRPKGRIHLDGKAVVVSGCDSGFGHMLALKLDDLGFQVFAGCLFPDGEGANTLKKSASSRLHVLKMDVANDEDIQNAVTYVNEKLGKNELWAVVSNAGINDGGDIMWTDMETIKRVIDINTFGVVRVTKAFLPQICKAKGRVVAVASSAGRYSYMGMIPYCMSKHAVVSFCDGLRLEMYRWGVQVITVEPWMYRTNICNKDNVIPYVKRTWDNAPEEIRKTYPPEYIDNYMKSIMKFTNISVNENPSEVVSCLEEAVTAKYPKYSYNPGTLYSRFSFWFIRRFPKPLADLLITTSGTVPYHTIDE